MEYNMRELKWIDEKIVTAREDKKVKRKQKKTRENETRTMVIDTSVAKLKFQNGIELRLKKYFSVSNGTFACIHL